MTTPVQAGKKNNNKWIWIGVGGAAVFCLCAARVVAFLALRAGQKVAQSVKTDPEAAAQAAHAIADYQLPPGYQEQVAMNLFIYTMVMIAPDSGTVSTSTDKPIMMLAQFQAGADQDQMEQQIRQSF